MPYQYRINQFAVDSDLPLPVDPGTGPDAPPSGEPLRVRLLARAPDIFPEIGWIARRFDGALRSYGTGDGVLLRVGERLSLHVNAAGDEVAVHAEGMHRREAALYVIGAGMALCTALRGDLPLHAAGAEIDGARVALLAPSGTGKSTTLWSLLEHGGRFANDDLIPVRLVPGGAVGIPAVSLYPKVDDRVYRRAWQWLPGSEMAGTRIAEVLPGEGKFWFPLAAARRVQAPAPLRALFVLCPARDGMLSPPSAVRARRVIGAAAVSHLIRNTMGPLTAAILLGQGRVLARFIALAEAVPVFTLDYEKRFSALTNLVRAIRDIVSSTDGHRNAAAREWIYAGA